VSRSFIPADQLPFLGDWPRLGVAVSAIALHTSAGIEEVKLDHPALTQGWHAAEREGALSWRWTSGDAGLPLRCAEGGVLELRIHATGTYETAVTAAKESLAA
jgi:hypothetical protein